MKRKINLQLSWIALIAIVATAVGITLVYYSLFQIQVHKDLNQNAHLLMETEVFQNAYSSDGDTTSSLNKLSSDNLRITWIDQDGTVLFDNDTNAMELENHLDRPEIQEAFAHGEGESSRRSDTQNLNTFYYALLLENGTVLRVSTQARTMTSVFETALPVILVIAIVVLMICISIAHFLTTQLMKPIDEMAENLEDSGRTPAYRELEPFADKIRSQHENILSAARSRQDFTASVSHELKTPITAISGYAELIENRMVNGEDAVTIAGRIRQNADRLLSLITDIIQLSELDHKELPRTFEEVDLLSLAKDCVENLRPMAVQKNVRISVNGSVSSIKADRSLIREMIDNLVQNAIRYNKDGGTAAVSVRTENGHPLLEVRDTGIGIPADHQEHVFERFYRVDKSRSRETGGTGLGLAIVKHIAEIHAAEITLNSTPGKGTVVQVRF